MARKTHIQIEDRNPWGDEIDESVLNDPGVDSTYVEGYSDVRRNRELAVRDGKRPPSLRHRLQWARAKTYDGQRYDGQRVMHWQVNKHHKMLPYDEALKLGYMVDKNPAITKGEDGLAYLGERVLMYAPAEVAAANLQKVNKNRKDLADKPRRDMEAATERFNKDTKGAHAEPFAYVGDDPDDA